MKKILNAPEVNLVKITHDVIATSGEASFFSRTSDGSQLVGARFSDEYDEEEEW